MLRKRHPSARVWQPHDNRYGWTSYLGVKPGSDGVSPYAAAARREDLAGLSPAWLGVGTLDVSKAFWAGQVSALRGAFG
jgi:hypothetical protein